MWYQLQLHNPEERKSILKKESIWSTSRCNYHVSWFSLKISYINIFVEEDFVWGNNSVKFGAYSSEFQIPLVVWQEGACQTAATAPPSALLQCSHPLISIIWNNIKMLLEKLNLKTLKNTLKKKTSHFLLCKKNNLIKGFSSLVWENLSYGQDFYFS